MQQQIYAYGDTNRHARIENELDMDLIEPGEAAFLHGYYEEREEEFM